MVALIAGDVGGTKVLLRAFDSETNEVLAQKRYLSADYTSLSVLVNAFIEEFSITQVKAACFGLPGPVQGRRAHLTNLPWLVDADFLVEHCQIEHVEILNDFAAAAYGIDELVEEDLLCLQAGEYQSDGNRLVIGAGSGLGVAPVKNCAGVFVPQPSEGGHMDFAPLTENQIELAAWMHKKWTHVSYERILSGEGIETLYFFFNAKSHGHSRVKISSAEDVHRMALAGDEIAIKTLDMFVEVYGAFIGNMALIWAAKAGIYIAGGIAPKILQWMQKPEFLEAVKAKGRMRPWVESMPIYLITNEQLGLLGAVDRAKTLYRSLSLE